MVALASTHFGKDSVPASITLAAKAKSSEHTRLRCLDRHCPLRSLEERAELNAVLDAAAASDDASIPLSVEIDPDDQEAPGIDDEIEGEEEDAEGNPVEPIPPQARCVQELWPFAFPKEWYKAIILGVTKGSRPSCIVLLTTSAHPSPAFVAHEFRIPLPRYTTE